MSFGSVILNLKLKSGNVQSYVITDHRYMVMPILCITHVSAVKYNYFVMLFYEICLL